MSFPVLMFGVFALGAVAVPVHNPTYAGYPGKAPYYLPGMQVAPGSADVNTANAVANTMLASISNGNSGAISTGRAYGSTAAGPGTSNVNGANVGTGYFNYIPMNNKGFDIAFPYTGTPVNSNGARSVNTNTNQNVVVPSPNLNTFMTRTSGDGNNANSGLGRGNNNGFNFNNNGFNSNNNGFSFNNGFNFNKNGLNVNNNVITNNGFNWNNIGSAHSNTNGNGARGIMNSVGDMEGVAPGANNAANVMVMVPMPATSGNIQNGNQLMTGNGQTGNEVTGTVPANGPMSGIGMLVHGPDCNIPGQSGNGNAGSNGNTGATNGANMVPVFAKGNAYAGINGNIQAGKY